MKVVLDLGSVGPNSGLGQFGQQLARRLAQDGHLRLVFLHAGSLQVPAGAVRRPAMVRSLVARWERPQVWHAIHARLPIPRGVPALLTVHDLMMEANDPRRRERLQAAVKQARALAFVSQYTRDVARTTLEWEESLPTEVIPHGVHLEPATAPPFLVPRRFLLALGELRPRKNLKALLPLLAELPDLSVLIAGNRGIYPDYERQLAELAAQLGVSERVCLCGPVREGEKTWLYQRCEALVMPSLNEGFGMPVVEAMSLGKPVFLSRLTSLPEVGGPHAHYWDDFQGESMAAVVRRGLAEHRSEPVREWAARFGWERAAAAYTRLYERIARPPDGPTSRRSRLARL